MMTSYDWSEHDWDTTLATALRHVKCTSRIRLNPLPTAVVETLSCQILIKVRWLWSWLLQHALLQY